MCMACSNLWTKHEFLKGDAANIEIVRIGVSKQSITVEVVIDDGTAVKGIDYVGPSYNITFSNVETSINISISTKWYIKIELSNSTFGTKIAKCTNSGVIRFLSKTVINFIDIEILYSVISYLNYYRNTNC